MPAGLKNPNRGLPLQSRCGISWSAAFHQGLWPLVPKPSGRMSLNCEASQMSTMWGWRAVRASPCSPGVELAERTTAPRREP